MTFKEWYKSYNTIVDPLLDDLLEEIQSAYPCVNRMTTTTRTKQRKYWSNCMLKASEARELYWSNCVLKANEARELAGVGDDEEAKALVNAKSLVNSALLEIERLAKGGERRAFLKSEPWVNGVYRGEPTVKLAYKILEELGYTVRFFYEGRQLVDRYTLIEW